MNKQWMNAADPDALDEARDTMEGMVESYHPADRPSKWRDLAEYAARRAKEVQDDNERRGVPER